MTNQHFTPTNRVTTIVTASIKELSKFKTKVIQETLETIVVGESDAELSVIFICPIGELLFLSIRNRHIRKALIGGIQFVSEGSNSRAVVLDGEIHIASSNKC